MLAPSLPHIKVAFWKWILVKKSSNFIIFQGKVTNLTFSRVFCLSQLALCISYCHMKKAPPMNTFDFNCIKSVHRWCCFHMTIRDTERANCDKLKTHENVKLVTFSWNMINKICNFWKMKKVWQPATLQPLEAHGQLVPFWKPPVSHCLQPAGHWDGRTFRAQKP